MNKISKLISGFAMLALLLSFFAFKSEPLTNRATLYFQYGGSAYTDGDYREISDWDNIPAPTTCPGDGHVCIISVNSDLLSGVGTPEEQLDEYFNSLDDPDEVKNFVETPSRIVEEKS